MARLLILRGEVSDREVELKGKTVRLGRGPQNDVKLEDEGKSISRNHAEIRYEGGRYVLVDLESQNGVWVAGKKVVRVVLEPNVVASVGPYRLMVEPGGASAAYRPDALTYAGPGLGPMTDSGSFAGPEPLPKEPTPAPGPAPRVAAVGSKSPKPPMPNWLSQQPKWLLPGAGAAIVVVIAIAAFILMRGPSGPSEQEKLAAATEAHLASAASLIQAGECARALSEHLEPALTTDPANVRAQTLRNDAEACRQAAVPPPPPPPVGPTPDEIAAHLREANQLVDTGQCVVALAEHIEVVLASEPTNPDALKLQIRAKTCPTPQPTQTQPAGDRLAVRIPPEKGGLEPLAREQQKDYEQRIKVMRERYDEAVAALSSGNFQRADELLGGIVRDVKTDRYLDAGRLWTQAKGGVRQLATKIYQGAMELEKRDEWDKAIQEFHRVQETDPTLTVEGDVRRVTDKKTALGVKRCEEGRTNFSYPNRNAEALSAYEDAIKLLPQSHPCFAEAKKNLALLRAGK